MCTLQEANADVHTHDLRKYNTHSYARYSKACISYGKMHIFLGQTN